ncbi:protein translocase subunit SecD [Patescibacteria group bacterium]|nr:protein translocase subunit SecD [Patescibacteria group bacterium]
MEQKHYILIAVLAIAVLSAVFSYPSFANKGISWINQKFSQNLPLFAEKEFKLGLDLKGGVRLIYQADLADIGERNPAEAMSGLRDVIERRINLFGVAEPVIQVQGQDRLVVELPGVTNVDEAIQMIGETPYLEFLEQRAEEETQQILDKLEEVKDMTIEEIQKVSGWELAFQNPYLKTTELTGQYLKSANVVFDQRSFKPTIELQFNDDGSTLFAEITGRNVGKPLAIFLDGGSIIDTTGDGKIDGQDLYAPVVQEEISGGKAVITGNTSVQTANQIVQRLNSGALPVKIGAPVSQETVGPTLGTVSLNKSLTAGLYGFLAVIVFMIIFYRIPGLLASVALAIYVVLALALFKLIPVTLTLAGIGGFILSIGMAVDANILIFARMKEELKAGQTMPVAIQEGFKRAWPSIRDSNVNSLIVCAILFTFATSFIKGFALTLSLGILVSLFSAIFITRILLLVFMGKRLENIKWLV